MGRINVLDKHTAEKIAAGEVVERPASVIKELVENSIDAGATSVTVEIKNGGITYMRVTDNGVGMDREDARTAFLRHATSKIKSDKDLERILTLGFRGEALCSIAAVSRTELFTKQKQLDEGSRVVIEGGEELVCEAAGCPDGTTIVVKNLFYNTPARMKFLKKDSSEGAQILDCLNKQALSHPNVSVRLIRDGKDALFSPGDNDLKNAVHSVFGRDIANSMTSVDYSKNGVRVTGLTGGNNLSRPNRLMQVFFVNNRFVASKTLYTAVSEAYKNELMVGRFPVCVLNVELDASLVDVNVHPGKTEVKFASDKDVYEGVYWAVKNALNAAASPRAIDISPPLKAAYKMPLNIKEAEQIKISALPRREAVQFKPYTPPARKAVKKAPSLDMVREELKNYEEKLPLRPIEGAEIEKPEKEAEIEKEIFPEKDGSTHDFRIIGQLFSTYILVELDSDFILIDQHAAHERIKYEELKARGGKGESQLLLMPISVNLTPPEKALAIKNEEFLHDMGFELEDFGENSVIIRSLPADCPYTDGSDLLIELLSIIGGNSASEFSHLRDKAVYTVACKAAIKANKALSMKEMEEIYLRASELEGISTCPHGRPISIKLTKNKIEKMFGRIV
ncbi:MAG: DNA mismatch repair endonuclease MutL [Clostridia bacterium]|nr:DNA mismatch repair endonuclease MutL [Clostridia bacterium]